MSDAKQDESKADDLNKKTEASDENKASTDSLNQKDIDQVIDEGRPKFEGTVYWPDGRKLSADEKVNIAPFDFFFPSFLTGLELRQLGMKYEKFAQYLAAQLSLFLRSDIQIEMKDLSALTFEEYAKEIENPTHMVLFNVKELPGVGLLNINSRLAMTIVNRMLGGKLDSIDEARALTDIESVLVDDVAKIILKEWCGIWSSFKKLESKIVGKESDSRFMHSSSSDSVMFRGDLIVTMGDLSEKLQITVPVNLMEPIVKGIKDEAESYRNQSGKQQQSRWVESYDNISVPVYAEWNADDINVRDVLQLRSGDILEMPKTMLQNTRIKVMNSDCFLGEAGVDGNYISVKIKNKIKKK